MVWYGIAALSCYGVHATFHLVHGRPEDLLWACHLGAAIVGVGLIAPSQTVNGIGTLFLCLGTPIWLMDLVGGGEFYPTSLFTHVGGLAIGLFGVHRLGMPRGSWWKTCLALVVLILISRLVTPAAANVNVAFAIYPGMERFFRSHLSYLTTMICIAGAYFVVAEFLLRRLLAPQSAMKGNI
jgi:hypothetical protein